MSFPRATSHVPYLTREQMVEVDRATGAEGAPALALEAAADPGFAGGSAEASEPLVVPGVERRLVQVFENLVANARSFSPPGGAIRLTARRDEGWVVVTVEDDGPGIPAAKLAAVFDRFYTERPAGEKFGTHSGLGLSIAKQIVEAHGGTVVAENRGPPDHPAGARLIVRLPV